MESTTKTKLTNEELQGLVSVHFGCEIQSCTELTEGHMNTIYQITLKPGEEKSPEDIILKVSYFEGKEILTYEWELMRAEVRVYELLADKGLPVPKVLHFDFSHKLIAADYFFMTVATGVSWESVREEISQKERACLLQELGAYQAIIHSVQNDTFGYYKNGSCPFATWGEAFISMMQDVLEDGRARDMQLPYESILEVVLKRRALLEEVREARLVDFDLWSGNVLLEKRDGTWHISGLLDFERAFFGDPYADFIASINLYSDVSQEPDFLQGYQSICSEFQVTERDKERMKLYWLYMNVIMYVETYRFHAAYRERMQQYCGQIIEDLLEELM